MTGRPARPTCGSTRSSSSAGSRRRACGPRHNLSQNFLADVDVLEGILREAAPGARAVRARDRAGARVPHRRPARVGRERDRRGARPRPRRAAARDVRGGAGDRAAADRGGRRARPGPRPPVPEPPYDVVANLPYHITSPILHRLLGGAPRAERLVLMVQREVAERVAPDPGGHVLPVGVRASTTRRRGSRSASPARRSSPRPKVESAVLVLEPYPDDDRLDAGAGGPPVAGRPGGLPRAAQDAPQRPRPASSRSTPTGWMPRSTACGIDRDRRPQTLAVGEWIALAEALGDAPRRGRRVTDRPRPAPRAGGAARAGQGQPHARGARHAPRRLSTPSTA